MATRRAVLARAACGLGVLACRGAVGQPAERAAYVAVETSARTGLSRARFVTASGAPTGAVPLDLRAHGMARHGDTLVVFPRRPGTRFAVVDAATLEVRAVVDAPAGRHFYGHGAFTADGRTLLTTENDLDELEGWLGVYDLAAGSLSPPPRLGTVPLPMPGPHDVARMPGTGRFHVALGGLRTHPDYGRTPLNAGDFASAIAAFDPATGAAEAWDRWPGIDGVSLRHLAADGAGRLYVGGQVADPARGAGRPVLWMVEKGGAAPVEGAQRLGGYVSSVAARDGAALAASKETGTVLRIKDGRVVGATRIDGASAVALGPSVRAASGFATLAIGEAEVRAGAGHEFDNHGLALG